MPEIEKLEILHDYAAGHLGTRAAIARLGLDDYADLIIALSVHDLPFPKPAETPELRSHRKRASDILQPLLRKDADRKRTF